MAVDSSLGQGDFVAHSENGAVKFGIIKDEGIEYEGQQRQFSVENGPNGELSIEVPEGVLTKLDTSDQQREVVEKERQNGLLQISLRLKKVREKAAWAVSRIEGKTDKITKHNTGIFVVIGVYSGNGPHSAYITAVSADQNFNEEEVSAKLMETYPNGITAIPGESNALPFTTKGKLIAYQSYELPPEAAKLIDWELQKI